MEKNVENNTDGISKRERLVGTIVSIILFVLPVVYNLIWDNHYTPWADNTSAYYQEMTAEEEAAAVKNIIILSQLYNNLTDNNK